MHPVLLAAYAHRRLVDIHPFQDGNGRTARLLMNLILVNRGYCVVSIPPLLRHDSITALQQAQRAQGPSDAALPDVPHQTPGAEERRPGAITRKSPQFEGTFFFARKLPSI